MRAYHGGGVMAPEPRGVSALNRVCRVYMPQLLCVWLRVKRVTTRQVPLHSAPLRLHQAPSDLTADIRNHSYARSLERVSKPRLSRGPATTYDSFCVEPEHNEDN